MRILKILVTIFILAAGGCMGSPYNGQYFPSRDATIPFRGGTTAPGQLVFIEACLYVQGSCVPFTIASTHSSTSGTQDSNGVLWYSWQIDTVIERGFWASHISNTYWLADIRARVRQPDGTEQTTWTYNNDFSQCSLPWGSAQLTTSAPCAIPASQNPWIRIKVNG